MPDRQTPEQIEYRSFDARMASARLAGHNLMWAKAVRRVALPQLEDEAMLRGVPLSSVLICHQPAPDCAWRGAMARGCRRLKCGDPGCYRFGDAMQVRTVRMREQQWWYFLFDDQFSTHRRYAQTTGNT